MASEINWTELDKGIKTITKKFKTRHNQLLKGNLSRSAIADEQMKLIDAEAAEVAAFRRGFLSGLGNGVAKP